MGPDLRREGRWVGRVARRGACPLAHDRKSNIRGEATDSPMMLSILYCPYVAGLKTANCTSSQGSLGQSGEQPPLIELIISLVWPGMAC